MRMSHIDWQTKLEIEKYICFKTLQVKFKKLIEYIALSHFPHLSKEQVGQLLKLLKVAIELL